MNIITANYHATLDLQFSPSVEFVPANSPDNQYSPDYYRLRLHPFDFTVFATREQLCQIMAAIAAGIQPAEQMPLTSTEAPVESDESYEASEALLNARSLQKAQPWAEIPVLQRCSAEVLPLTAPEFTPAVQA